MPLRRALQIVRIVAVAGLPATAIAHDGYWDFRFGLGSEPRVSEAKYDYDASTPDFTQEFDAPGSSLEFNIAHRFASSSPHGAMVTFGAFLRGFDGDDGRGTDLRLAAIGIQGGGGYSFRPNRFYTLEVGPRLGIGAAGSRERIAGSEDLESDSGAYARVDVAATSTFNFQRRFQLGLTAGVASWAATQRYDAQTLDTSTGPSFFPGADVTYSGAGGYVTFSAGFR